MRPSPAEVARLLAAPPAGLGAVLLYGPDSGLVKERAATLVQALAGAPTDPFLVAELSPAALRETPGALADEAASLSFTGGRRVVRLREAGDAVTTAVDILFEAAGAEALVVVEAGDLGPQSRLRKQFETAARAAAVPCYGDDARSLPGVIRDTLATDGLTPDDDALAFLCGSLGADRLVTRSELEKLALYVGAPGTVTLEDAQACVGDSAALASDDIAFAAIAGDQTALARALARALSEGGSPVSILRNTARHVRRLHQVAGQLADGVGIEQALRGLRPPVFFKWRDQFARQARAWPVGRLADALDGLTRAELACKTTAYPARTICHRALMELAAARRTGRS